MSVDKIDALNDSRISHQTADLNGRTYHYLLGHPKGEPRNTVFLIHGWPDLSMGWRYQIPMFLDMGLRVVCPDMMGYGRTDAPNVPPESLSYYSFKRAADDIKELAKQLGVSRIILGGHDWGGAIVYRVALWYPELISHLFSICTPYIAPTKHFVSLEDAVKTVLPQFGYQIHLASGEVEKAIVSKEQIRQFLNARYGGQGPNGEVLFSPEKGVIFENLSEIGPSPLLTGREIDYYVNEYTNHGLHGTLNWYRTRELNFQEELTLEKSIIDIPVLFVQALHDSVLTPNLSRGMEQYFPKLTRREVATGHWALWQAPAQVNGMIREWLEDVGFGHAKSSL
ncbi:hypothetical protein MMC17_008856 [Xylographa soralifera]|nr:hypothetical protein [Xylographa soralifera]